MSTGDSPQVQMVEVQRYDILLTLDDILNPLMEPASRVPPAAPGAAPDPQVAQLIGQWAEHYRKEKALLWLGREMPNWPQPCPLHVVVNMQAPGGATTFQFGQGQVLGMKMEIQGPLERLVRSVLPHEVTHTVFAHHFRHPVPRWADEGGSVLSEDDLERDRHDQRQRS